MIHSDVAQFRGAVPPPHVPPEKPVVAEEEVHEVEYAPNGDVVLSPSQVDKYINCPRQWAGRYIHGQHEPSNASAAAGKRMHKLLEDFYKTKVAIPQDTPEGVWAWALLKETGLPAPGPGVEAEGKFKFEFEGVWWRGSKDLRYMHEGWRTVRDHKSTSELNPMWIKSPDVLLTDPQSVIYAFHEYLMGADRVTNEWGYCTREKNPKTLLVPVDMPREHTIEQMMRLSAIGREMLGHYRAKTAIADLPHTGTRTGRCEAFSGCKVSGCDVSTLDRIMGLQLFNIRKKEIVDMSSYIEQLQAKRAAAAALGQTPAASPSAPPPAAAAPAPLPPPPVTEPVVPASEPPPALDIRARLAAQAALTPPAYTPPAVEPSAPVADPPPAAPAGASRRGRQRAPAPAPLPAAAPPAAQAPVYTEAAAVVPPVTKVDRVVEMSKYVLGVAEAPAPASNIVIEDCAMPPGAQITVPPQLAAADGYVLCVNCLPMGEQATLFSTYAEHIHANIKDMKGWLHYSVAQFDGAAVFKDVLTQALQANPPTGYLVVDSRTSEGRDALSILEQFASKPIFRGF